MIVTGYFARIKHYVNLPLVSVALYKPKWLTTPVLDYPDLYPTDKMLRNYRENHDINQYIYDYYSQVLLKLDVSKVAKDLDNKILLCYEKSSDFCHRHIISYWLCSHGYEAKEYNVNCFTVLFTISSGTVA